MYKIASLGRLFHSLISTVMMIVNMLSIRSLDNLDDDYRWMNFIMFLIGLTCKIPNIVLNCIFKKRLTTVLKEYCDLNHTGGASVTELEKEHVKF